MKNNSLYIRFCLLMALTLVFSSCKDVSNNAPNPSGVLAPDFTLNTPDGKSITLSDLRGDVIILDFWASWCSFCKAENPNVVAFYQQYHNQGLEIIGVSIDEDANAWKNAILNQQLPYLHVIDTNGWKASVITGYQIKTIPHLILINKEGKIVATSDQIKLIEVQAAALLNTEKE